MVCRLSGLLASLDVRKTRDVELHNWSCSTKIIRVMNSRRISWVERVEGMDSMRNACRIFVGKTLRVESASEN